jgi:hypothetical protein
MTTKRSVKDDEDSVHEEGMASLMGAREVMQQRASLFAAKSMVVSIIYVRKRPRLGLSIATRVLGHALILVSFGPKDSIFWTSS